MANMSEWQTPQACTRTRTSPLPGRGTVRSTTSSGPPALATCTARIVAMNPSFLMPTWPTAAGHASTMNLPDENGVSAVVYSAPPGTAAEDGLKLLAS
ncbi:hypothetical protein ACIRYZ_41970 [Kitasatospora sp. NPDC101155]|uniref:hypothetical protein n=1 Tax=Kitasatospora sp. NPDC101155 TaxID=3364097 RepID=UPI003829F97F